MAQLSVTQESIRRAKARRDAERDKVFRQTGLRIVDEPEPHKVQCGLCEYTARAVRMGQAINSVAAHIVRVHLQAPKEQV